MIKKPGSFRYSFIFIACVVLLLFVGKYFVFADIRQKNENTSVLEQEVASESGKQEYFAAGEDLLEGLTAQVEEIKGSILPADSEVDFIESLEALARTYGVELSITSLDIDESSSTLAEKGISILKIKAGIKGNWSSVYKVLVHLESLPYKTKIEAFSAAALENEKVKGATSNVWQSKIDLSVLKYNK